MPESRLVFPLVFEPLDFIARLAALVPKPRVHLTRYHGVFAPHSALRAEITLSGRGSQSQTVTRSPAERHRAMTWAQRLKRVFRIDIEYCERCGGKVKSSPASRIRQWWREFSPIWNKHRHRPVSLRRTAPADRPGSSGWISAEAHHRGVSVRQVDEGACAVDWQLKPQWPRRRLVVAGAWLIQFTH